MIIDTLLVVLVDMWRLVHQWSFLLFWLFFDCFWRLVHCWYSLGRPVTIGTPIGHFCCFDCLLTVFDDWYTVGTVLVDLWRLVHQSSFLLFWLYQQSKTVERQSKQQKWPLVYQSSHVYQDCTNSVPIVKNNQKQSKDSQNSKNDHWCTNRHMSTQSPPNRQSPRPRPRPPSAFAFAEYTKPFPRRWVAQIL